MSISLCVLRVEIDEELPEMGDNTIETARETKKNDRGARDSRTITVETYASVAGSGGSVGGAADLPLLPTSTRRLTETTDNADETIGFFCGNPLIEVTKGVLHIYKENELKPMNESGGPEPTMLCLLAVPAALAARDLLAFAAACQQDIAHVRVLRDDTSSHYMALLTFRTAQAARQFHSAFDGVPYSTLEPGALCHAAWVSRVEWARDGTPPPSHTELPTCPVCLERMDESVAGVLSVQCAHAFHTDCLLGWGDDTCPVCRCSQTPEPLDRAHCFECERIQTERANHPDDVPMEESKENTSGIAEGLLDGVGVGTLWICLICGHIGCGRYEAGHAAKHFRESNHTYALQLGSNRVWDYAGDNFVHRLLQNKSDGKLVAAGGEERPDGAGCLPQADKLDSAQLEFTYLLTQQLESQRQFYEEKLDCMEVKHKVECEVAHARAERAETAAAAFEQRLVALTKENKTLEKKLNHVNSKLSALSSELSEERGLASAMASSQAEWQRRAKSREGKFETEISELKEQLRDVMFYVEARSQLERTDQATSSELQGASVSVAPAAGKKGRKKR